MDRDTLLALAARVEAAAGADRALDAEIAVAIGWHNSRVCELWTDERGRHWPQGPCRYTASLDAAASLVPAGWTGMVHLGGKAGLYRDDREPTIDGSAATPALALCAAALRARAEEARDG